MIQGNRGRTDGVRPAARAGNLGRLISALHCVRLTFRLADSAAIIPSSIKGGATMPNDARAASRRRFLQFLAASPLLAASDFSAIAAETPSRLPDPMIWAPRSLDKLITSPKEAINIFDLEAVAAKNMPPAHFGYVAGGVNDDVTLRANREGFLKFQLRPRRLVDVSKVDMSTEIFGVKYDSPIIIAPSGGHYAYHAEGEPAVARAAKVGDHLQILSTNSTTSIKDVIAARRKPIW